MKSYLQMWVRVRLLSLCALVGLSLTRCTPDRDFNVEQVRCDSPEEDLEVLHYWNFNQGSTPSALRIPAQSIGGADFSYAGDSFDAASEGSTLNALPGDPEGQTLRLRNPAGDLILNLPTTGYQELNFSYATMRTGNGAQEQQVFYSLTENGDFMQSGLEVRTVSVAEDFQRVSIRLCNLVLANNNPHFRIKIAFALGAGNVSGNNRIDNILLQGIPIDTDNGGNGNGGGNNGDTVRADRLLHYWDFNASTSGDDDPALLVPSFTVGGTATLAYAGAYFDTEAGSTLNLRQGSAAGNSIRLRNPSEHFTVAASTAGHDSIRVSYSVERTNQGAQEHQFSYSLDGGTTYQTTGLPQTAVSIPTSATPQLVTLDLSEIAGVSNNPDFRLRITFAVGNDHPTSGNNRIDNLAIDGYNLVTD